MALEGSPLSHTHEPVVPYLFTLLHRTALHNFQNAFLDGGSFNSHNSQMRALPQEAAEAGVT